METANQQPKRQPTASEPGDHIAGLYRMYAPWLTAFLTRRFGRQAAEDLAQETFLRLTLHPEPRSPKALLAVTALNAARDLMRRKAVRPRLVQLDELPDFGAPASQQEAVLLRQVVTSLPHNLRTVFLLSRFGGMSNDEIAQHCGVSVKTVEARVTRALKLCALRLRD